MPPQAAPVPHGPVSRKGGRAFLFDRLQVHMPWSKEDGSEVEGCSEDEIAVVKDDDGSLEGCHESEEDADDQIAALEASEDDRADGDEEEDSGGQEDDEERADGEDLGEELSDAADDAEYGNNSDETEEMDTREYEGRSYTSRINDPEIRSTADGKVTVMIATDQIARDGMVLEPSGVDTTAYERNPVVLWEHGAHPNGGSVPIGRSIDLKQKERGYLATVEFDEGDEFASEIKRKVEDGFINAVSIGWKTESVKREERSGEMVPVVKEADMTEFSFVGVPADTEALVQSRMHYPEATDQGPDSIFRLISKGLIHLEASRRRTDGQTHAQAINDVEGDIEDNVPGGMMEAEGYGCPFEDMASPMEGFQDLADVLNTDADALMQAAAVDGYSYDRSALDDEDTEDNDERANEDEDSRDCGCGNEGTPSSPSAQDGTPSDAERDESPGIDELIDLSQRIGPEKVRAMANAIGTDELARLVGEHGAEKVAKERRKRAQIQAGKEMGVL